MIEELIIISVAAAAAYFIVVIIIKIFTYLGVYHAKNAGDKVDEGKIEDAIHDYEKALIYLEKVRKWHLIGLVSNDLGVLYLKMYKTKNDVNSLLSSEKYFMRALNAFIRFRYPLLIALAANNLSTQYQNMAIKFKDDEMKYLRLAKEYCEEAIRFSRHHPEFGSSAYNNLGIVLQKIYDTSGEASKIYESIKCFEESLKYREPNKYPLDYASSMNNLGASYEKLSDIEDMKTNLYKALDTYIKAKKSLKSSNVDEKNHIYKAVEENIARVKKKLTKIIEGE